MAKRKRKTSKEHLDEAIVKRKSKKSRTQLSDLPMDILSSIISRLPIKEAIRTSILSSHWTYVWCHHTNLNFSFPTMMPSHFYPYCPPLERRRNQRMFIKRVDDVLLQHSGARVEQISIRFDLHHSHTADINRWITFAIGSNTKALSLELWYLLPVDLHERESYDPERIELYSFPFQLFDASNGSHLQFLQFASISMKLPADFEGFINLKKLCLRDVNITDEDLQHLLSKCSLLEFLGVASCKTITSLRVPHPANHLKHLEIDCCSLLREIELNNGLTILEYRGHLIPFISSGNSSLTNICIKLLNADTSIEHLFTELPGTLPPPKTLTSNFGGLEKAISSRRHPKFIFLRNLILEMDIFAPPKIKPDVLDVAYLLQAAPFMEKLELHMFVRCDHKPYRREDNELRTLPPRPHSHLKTVHITGFFGHKDQLELALYILRNSLMLKAMKIDPSVVIVDQRMEPLVLLEQHQYLDGYKVATGFLREADKRDVIDVLEIVPTYPSRSKIWAGSSKRRGKNKIETLKPNLLLKSHQSLQKVVLC